jgi:hypothetical protein
MPVIDLHSGKEIKEDSSPVRAINAELVKDFVYEHVEFELPGIHWLEINDAFAEVWNNKIGLGNQFYWDDIVEQVFEQIQNKMLLIEYERVDRIITLILTYIEEHSGFSE